MNIKNFKLSDFDSKRTVRLKMLYLTPMFLIGVPLIAVGLGLYWFFNTLWCGYVDSIPDIIKVWRTGEKA